ncbi:MAG: fibrobacter succinogenes major paralogous domain-containing protein [Bacteroidales bacterium]|nr:fibrobacter succinogenes major paralogous domain-containing protein [Bacteroidales bacterium]
MKKLTILITMMMCLITIFAQAPEKFNYQAVVRNASNQLMSNASVGVRVSILQGSSSGSAVYVETQTVTTNANGLMTVEIGGGNAQQGAFANIDWSNGPYFLKTETDPDGGSNYNVTTTQQLMSVPYALYAEEAGNSFSGDYNDLTNTPDIPIVPTNVSAFTNDAGYITITDLQQLIDALNARIDSLENLVNNNPTPATPDTVDAQPCPGVPTVTDYDGNVYNTVQIGQQCWMKENLKTTHYSDGTLIPLGVNVASYTEDFRYCPDNIASNVVTYGYLYNWKAAMHNYPTSDANPSAIQGACPIGWHLPSDVEWTQLTDYVSGRSEYTCDSVYILWIAKSLAANSGWYTYNDNVCAVGYNQADNNATGFSARPAGYYIGETYYYPTGGLASFWSSTEAGGADTETGHYPTAYSRTMTSSAVYVIHSENLTQDALSVRCIKD